MRFVSTALGVLLLATSVSAGTIYVDKTATGANSGTSWTDALTDLRVALLTATPGDEIWVATGTYTPASGIDRSFSFQLVTGVAVYGGFAGTETLRSERNPAANVTILSGDIGVALDPSDNSYHVVNASGTDATAVIDGFTITDGRADGPWPGNLGGGLYCDPAGPTVANVLFTNNSSANGGGLCSRNGDITLINCGFWNNNSTGYGGGISIVVGTVRLTNLTIVGNTATTGAGGISGVSVTVDIANTILADNLAPGTPDFRVLNGTVMFSHSLVRGSGGSSPLWDPAFGIDAGGNVDVKPWLTDAASGNLRPLLRSPAVEAGDNSAPDLASVDVDWNPRIAGNTVDMGAYEVSPTCPVGPVAYVKLDAAGTADGTSWADAFTELHSALNLAEVCPSVTEIWVAAGDYYIQDGTERHASYRLISGVGIYGGFSGTETMRSQRDWLNNETSLNGLAPNWTQSAHQVVRAVDVDNTAVLDGFWVERAVGLPGINGGGLYIENASPVVANVRFDNNYQVDYGGGIYVASGSPTLSNAFFNNNLVNETGLAIYVAGGNLTLSGGYIRQAGIGYNDCVTVAGGTARIVNVTMVRENGITNDGATVFLTNSIVWGADGFVGVTNVSGGSTTVSHSLVKGSLAPASWNPAVGINGGGNLDTDPFFVSGFDFRPVAGSPAINSGDNGASPLPVLDLDGNPRIVDGTIDMGGWEWQGTCPTVNRVYVDENASGAGDGTSWTDAFTELRDALDAACANVTEIWVAAGTYAPTGDSDRTVGFRMRNGLTISGGFNGAETSLAQRDFLTNVTTLSGEIGTPTLDDNSERIVWGNDNDATAVLDGFTLSGAWGVGSTGGAILVEYSDAQFRNLILTGNYNVSSQASGAAMYAAWSDATISDVTFVDNDGGALFLNRGSPVVTNVVFEHNINGAALFTYQSEAELRNLIFFENSDRAIYHSYFSTPRLTNVTIIGTITGGINPAAVFNRINGGAEMWNSIIWGISGPSVYTENLSTAMFRHSIIEGSGGTTSWNTAFGVDGGGNLDTDPFLVDTSGGELMLRYNSPAINAGVNISNGLPPTDIAGDPRVIGGIVDMGAYEYQAPVSADTPVGPVLALDGAYPNPFNPSLTVEFSLDRARAVRVEIFNVRGALVRTLVEDSRGAGPHRVQWDGADNTGTRVASGVYLIRISSEGWKAHRKVLMLK